MQMDLVQNLQLRERSGAIWRGMLAILVLLFVMMPALDLAGVEPTLDQGVRCQLHANPAVVFAAGSVFVSRCAEFLPAANAGTYFPLLGSSIFVPPRA